MALTAGVRSLRTVLLTLPMLASAALAETPHGAEPNLLGGDIGNAIFTLIIFGIVVFVLGKFAWPNVLNALNERERFIHESLESAKSEREQAEKLLADYKQQLAKAQLEATAIVDEGRRDAEAVRQRLLEEARKESADLVARAKREIELAADTAVKELYDRTGEFALQVSSRVLRKAIPKEEHQRLVDDAIKEIETSGRARLN
jgi:F-type H+-transporting ATPase subunit b